MDNAILSGESDVRKAEGKAASDDEVEFPSSPFSLTTNMSLFQLDGAKEGKKKKKRSFFSFGKKKK